jgi:hypothetical protein
MNMLEKLLGKEVLVLCAGYFYVGKLTQVDAMSLELQEATIVYDVNNFDRKTWKETAQDKLPAQNWYIERNAIESIGLI